MADTASTRPTGIHSSPGAAPPLTSPLLQRLPAACASLVRSAKFEPAPGVEECDLDVAELSRDLLSLNFLPAPADGAKAHAACSSKHLEESSTDAAALLHAYCQQDLLRSYDAEAHATGRSCDTLVISFGGLNQGMGRAGDTHALDRAGHEFVGTCKRLGAHALFIRDPLQKWYLRGGGASAKGDLGGGGLSGVVEATDAFDELLCILEAEIAAVQPRRIVTVGASMGGYAAIRAGLSLGVDAVLAFGPQVPNHFEPTSRSTLFHPPPGTVPSPPLPPPTPSNLRRCSSTRHSAKPSACRTPSSTIPLLS